MEVSQSTEYVSPDSRPKRVKRPNEDAWLKVLDDSYSDRNLLDSRRRAILNPDLLKPVKLHCCCGNDVRIHEDWYVMISDGTLVCNNCAQCSCCAREVKPISRRLVCIDGLVLCYRCIKFFGHIHRTKLQLRVQAMSMKNPLDTRKPPPVNGSAVAGEFALPLSSPPCNVSNSEYYDYNLKREDRSKFQPKEDMRRPIRRRPYEAPERPLPREDDPQIVPPEYLADNSQQQPMSCPACNSIALGLGAYVVPSMARVYHKRCFRCCNCKQSLAHGVQIAGFSFEYCSCSVPLVWCTKAPCRNARFMHHNMTKCRLGCLRPGGRLQMDYTVEISTEKSPRRKRAAKTKKEPQQQLMTSVEDDASTVDEEKH